MAIGGAYTITAPRKPPDVGDNINLFTNKVWLIKTYAMPEVQGTATSDRSARLHEGVARMKLSKSAIPPKLFQFLTVSLKGKFLQQKC